MSFTKVAPAGIGTSPGNSILIGDSLLHSTGIDIGSNTGIGVTIRKHGDATFTGIITASAFFGDGSGLEGVSSSGIGTPLSDDDTSDLNKIYYVNQELSIGSTITVNHPSSAVASYTHYQDLVVTDDADFIVSDGDTFIPDVLGIRTSTSNASAATGGRIRAGTITNAGANGAPNFPNGVTGTSATFTTGTFTGNLGVGGVLTYEDVTNVDSVGVITARTDINLGDSIIHIGDTNTKIRFPSADTITAETNSSERLRITSSGLVGIGSITPANQLDIQGGSHTKIHVGTTGTGHATGIQINHAKGAAALQQWQLQTDATSTANLIIRNATTGNTIQSYNTTGNVTTPLQCGASVRMSASTTAFPGNNSFENSQSLLAFNTETYDIGSNYNTSTYAFTAPVAGRYLICYSVQIENITNAGWWYVYPVVNASNTQTQARGITYADYGIADSTAPYHNTNGTYIPLLQANDSVTLRARGAISGTIKGGFESSWSIMLIG